MTFPRKEGHCLAMISKRPCTVSRHLLPSCPSPSPFPTSQNSVIPDPKKGDLTLLSSLDQLLGATFLWEKSFKFFPIFLKRNKGSSQTFFLCVNPITRVNLSDRHKPSHLGRQLAEHLVTMSAWGDAWGDCEQDTP